MGILGGLGSDEHDWGLLLQMRTRIITPLQWSPVSGTTQPKQVHALRIFTVWMELHDQAGSSHMIPFAPKFSKAAAATTGHPCQSEAD